MADKSLVVTFSADVGGLQAKSAIAKSELTEVSATVKNLASQFRLASDEMKATLAPQLEASAREAAGLRSEIAALNAEMKEQASAPTTMFGQLSKTVTETTEAVEGLTEKFTAFQHLTSAVGEFVMAGLAVEQVVDVFKEYAETAEQLEHASEATGMSVESLSALRMVAKQSGTDFDVVTEGIQHLGMAMQSALTAPTGKAAQTFAALGVSVQDSNGQLRPVGDVLDELSAKLSQYADGTAKADDVSNIFGARMGSQLIPIMARLAGDGGIAGATAEAQKYGVVMSGAAADGGLRFKDASDNASLAVEGLKDEVAAQFMPVLTDLTEGFVQNAQQGSAMRGAVEGLEFVLEAATATVLRVTTVVDDFFKLVFTLGETLGVVGVELEAAADVMQGHFSQAAVTAKAGIDDLTQSWANLGQQVMANERLVGAAMGVMGDAPPAAPDAPKKQAPTVGGGDGGDGKDWMQSQRDALQQQDYQILQSAQNYKQADDEKLANTVTFWKGVTTQAGLSADQERQAQQELVQAEMAMREHQLEAQGAASKAGTAVAKQDATQQVQIAQDAANTAKQVDAARYEAQVALWKTEVDQGLITKTQETQYEINAQDQKYAAAVKEVQDELQLSSITLAGRAKLNGELEVMQAQHVAQMAQMNVTLVQDQIEAVQKVQDAQTAAAQATDAAWQRAFQPVTQAMDSSLNGIIQGTETLRLAEDKAAQSVTLAFIDAEAKKVEAFAVGELQILAKGVATQLGLVSAAESGAAAQLAAKATATTTGKAIDATTGAVQINNSAHSAAAGAYSAVAGIPIIGPVLAPAAAATAYAGVMAFDVLSAEGGMVVPAGVDPLTQLHEQEMVLPAHIANPLQSAIAGGTLGGGGGDQYHLHVNNTVTGGNTVGGVSTEDVMSALSEGLRRGLHTSGQYPALARAMRR